MSTSVDVKMEQIVLNFVIIQKFVQNLALTGADAMMVTHGIAKSNAYQ